MVSVFYMTAMVGMTYSIRIPDILNTTESTADAFVKAVLDNLSLAPLAFDMSYVRFIYPYGAMLLLSVARYVTKITGSRVCLYNLQPKVAAYLERMDLFENGCEWLYADDVLSEKFFRSKSPTTLVEVARLQSVRSQAEFLNRARRIMNMWLSDNERENDGILTVLSEICGNAREWSGDEGQAMIQCYNWSTFTEVHIAVIDLGVGISESLRSAYGSIAQSDEEFILRALEGYSARGKQKGGAGLQMVRKRIAQHGGELAIRSNTGLVTIKNGESAIPQQLCAFPGTQVAVTFRNRTT